MEDEDDSEDENAGSKRNQTNDVSLKETEYVFSKGFGAGVSRAGSVALWLQTIQHTSPTFSPFYLRGLKTATLSLGVAISHNHP